MPKVVPLNSSSSNNQKKEIITTDMDQNVKYHVSFNKEDNEAQLKYKYSSNLVVTSKYTAWNFVPKNFFNQFKRFYNMYFLVGAVLAAALRDIVPIAWYTMVFPLVFVVGVTLLKDGYEDYKRHVSDRVANELEYKIVKDGKVVTVLSQDINVGDIMYVTKGEKFPSDLVLVSSSSGDGTCYVETCELDGETNLKRRQAIEDLSNLVKSPEDASKLVGCIQGDPPNDQLNAFTARMILESCSKGKSEQVFSLSLQQCFLRGSKLRNTDYIYGIVMYAGKDTKIFRNAKSSKMKFSSMERKINLMVLIVLIFNFAIVILSSVFAGVWQVNYGVKHSYIGISDSFSKTFGESFIGFFIAYSYMIPLSLFVTIEVVRVVQGLFMEWDDDLTSADGLCMKAKNTNLNEDLGSVEYVFSDKTGTLTQNEMKVAQWYVSNQGIFDEEKSPGILSSEMYSSDASAVKKSTLAFYLKAISVCHTVLPATEDSAKNTPYEAPSPDELALLLGLKANGIILKERTKSSMKIEYPDGSVREYRILQVLEFNSDRKRMSIIVKSEDGIELFCKGADSFVFRLLSKSNTETNLAGFQDAVDKAANLGLRTLAVAWKKLSQSEFDDFNKAFTTAESSLENREENVNKACEIIEKDLMLLGATAIEDRLQDRVPETLEYLVTCGVKVWLLTGDKQETAINIGMSSKLISPKTQVLKLNVSSEEEAKTFIAERQKIIERVPIGSRRFSLVIDGFSLTFILPKLNGELLNLATLCETVICCRVTPLQKAMVVRMVKKALKKICLSIGDGANDVSMIQEAHIGVGIMGKEGSQAARSADYSFSQFKFLKKLMVLHGRYSNLRIGKLVLYSFYKNMALIMVFLWYSPFFGWSAQIVYNEVFLTFFNVIFTSFAPLFLAIFEKDISEKTIAENPKAYAEIKNGVFFNRFLVFTHMTSGILHSVWNWGLSYLFLQKSGIYISTGLEGGIVSFQFFLSSITYLTVYYKFFLTNRFCPAIIPIFHVLSALVLVFNMFWGFNDLDAMVYDAALQVQSSPTYWLGILLIPIVALIPDFTYDYLQRQLKPTDGEILREQEKYLFRSNSTTQIPSPS